MTAGIRIGVIGDFEPVFHSHFATNAALYDAATALKIPLGIQSDVGGTWRIYSHDEVAIRDDLKMTIRVWRRVLCAGVGAPNESGRTRALYADPAERPHRAPGPCTTHHR